MPMPKDIIKVAAGQLYTHFSASGETQRTVVLPLANGLTVHAEQKNIIATLPSSNTQTVIESFPNETYAQKACEVITQKISSYLSFLKYAALLKSSVKWGVIPTFLFLAVLAVNSALFFPATAPFNAPSAAAHGMPVQVQREERPKELAAALAKGVSSGRYTVTLGTGKKGILYVFTDPSCPHCRKLEPILNSLKQDMTIHLFPVSVIGGDVSARAIELVLCSTGSERTKIWQAAVQQAVQTNNSCEAGKQSLATNNLVFSKTQMEGTPTLVRADGQMMPASVGFTPEAIAAWVNEGSVK